MIRLTEIEKRARAATPGPWRRGSDDLRSIELFSEIYYADNGSVIAAVHMNRTNSKERGAEFDRVRATAAHIATMSPDVALRMVAVVRAAARLANQATGEQLSIGVHYELEALRAALAEIQE